MSNSQLKSLSRQSRGRADFDAYYTRVYGDRWPALAEALTKPTRYAALVNRYIGQRNSERVRRHLTAQGAIPFEWSTNTNKDEKQEYQSECFVFPIDATTTSIRSDSTLPSSSSSSSDVDSVSSRFTPPIQLLSGLDPTSIVAPSDDPHMPLPYYPLDLGSVLAVSAMRLDSTDHVFDMCAAPGGKSITIAQHLALEDRTHTQHKTPILHVNDVSAARRRRLQNVLRGYLPVSISHDSSRIFIHSKDLLTCKVDAGHYDCVLLDAPCSTDRHTLHTPTELESWSPARFRRDSDRQVSLLMQALRTVKPGGTVIYATCSLTPEENDQVIQATKLKCDKWKQKGRSGRDGIQVDFVVEPIVAANSHCTPDQQTDRSTPTSPSHHTLDSHAAARSPPIGMPFGEPTEYGWMILPDQPMPAATTPVTPPTRADLDQAASSAGTGHGFGPIYIARLTRV